MNDYTAEDFQNAMFAVLPKYGLRAHKSEGESYWQRDGIKRATNTEMAEAGWRPVREHNPRTLDALREAWENAEQSEDCRVGDVLIKLLHSDDHRVYVAKAESRNLPPIVRVLSRAPQPEPWQGLADVLRAWDADLETGHSADSMARWFYERGVRVTGGDDDE